MLPVDRWLKITAFYRELTEDHGWNQRPMFEFVSWLGASDASRDLWPSTSHESLGLATVPTYHERLERPMVFVIDDQHQGPFVVRYHQRQNRSVRREVVATPSTPEVFSQILSWLRIEQAPACCGGV